MKKKKRSEERGKRKKEIERWIRREKEKEKSNKGLNLHKK